MSRARFNYIITIHNKEDLIEKVLDGVISCCGENSHVYTVLDGCTDRTEEHVDSKIAGLAGIAMTKIHTPDVHELLSINAGLKAAEQKGEGFNIILQDDVVLEDKRLENKVIQLYRWVGPSLGYVSFRLGANFTKDAYCSNNPVPYRDYVENAFGHGIRQAAMLPLGYVAFRTVAIKSPVCLPFRLVREIGPYNEKLAPYGHDDPELCIRVHQAGYKNAVFAVRFSSDVEWGGTRNTPHPEMNSVVARNMDYIRQIHNAELRRICTKAQAGKIARVPGMEPRTARKESKREWRSKVRPPYYYWVEFLRRQSSRLLQRSLRHRKSSRS